MIIVGEAFGEREEFEGRPFVGPSGHLLMSVLREAGISLDDAILTNVFNERPPGGEVENYMTKDPSFAAFNVPQYKRSPKMFLRHEHKHHYDELWSFIERTKPNVIVALGQTAMWALTSKGGIDKQRGAPLLSHRGGFKILPTYHPSSILRMWKLRPILRFDLEKAKREDAYPEIRRPKRDIILEPSLKDLDWFYENYIRLAPFITVDIETREGQITEIGFGVSRSCALVLPFYYRQFRTKNYWITADHERRAWEWVRKVLAEKPVVNQNTQYDIQYLWRTMRIPVPHFLGDTMLLHHALQPEKEKGLGFLGSIYTNEPAWKFMRHEASTLKRED